MNEPPIKLPSIADAVTPEGWETDVQPRADDGTFSSYSHDMLGHKIIYADADDLFGDD